MEVVGSEIGQKMRSAIKAKLTELGCYVDDELPDYVMVMVANKRTREQMEEDLQLFLGDNTQVFVNWLHQVLRKLQEVTVAPMKPVETETVKEKLKEKKNKTKKVKEKSKSKSKKTDGKKAKKKDKEKSHKKGEKKAHKSKKKSKKHESIRPNIPPLLMNIEKESEPSITDVFAGQILKNHGITIDMPKYEKEKEDTKPIIKEKRPILPIIDPATIQSQPEVQIPIESQTVTIIDIDKTTATDVPSTQLGVPREEQIKEINEIEAKIQGLKQKLAEQLDSMSEDEDFLNIRTEAEELMNDFAEDVFQEISSQAPAETIEPSPPKPFEIQEIPKDIPNVNSKELPRETPEELPGEIPKELHREIPKELPREIPRELPREIPKEIPNELPETIELKLPKRPVRERLGAREEAVKLLEKTKLPEKRKSPERLSPEPEVDFWGKAKPSARSRLGSQTTEKRRGSDSSDSTHESGRKKVKSSSSDQRRSGRAKCASVVVVKPRMRPQASSLLLRAVADAHKSLLNIPPKLDAEPHKVKRALVLPMRRCVDNQKIVIQVDQDRKGRDNVDTGDSGYDKTAKLIKHIDKSLEYVPAPLSRKFTNTDYMPSRRERRKADDVIDTINIHNTTVDKDKDTQFIVTMDGFNPNAFLAKKLMTEGLLNDEDELNNKPKSSSVSRKHSTKEIEVVREKDTAKHSSVSHKPINKDMEFIKEKDTGKKDENETTVEKIDTKKVEEVRKKIETNEAKLDDISTAKKIETNKAIVDEISTPKSKELRKKTTDEIPEEIETNTQQDTLNIETEQEIQEDNLIESETEHTKVSRSLQNKRLSETSDDSDTQVIIKQEKVYPETKKRESDYKAEETPAKKRRGSPIVFDVEKIEREGQKQQREREKQEIERLKQLQREEDELKELEEGEIKRERTESASSENIIVTTSSAKKFEAVPPLSTAERKIWCRAFPLCKFGSSCAFQHPRCKYAPSCTRRGCIYSHDFTSRVPAAPVIASHVVPVANYKSISPRVVPNICRFYPNCSNTACRFHHPKPCRFGSACVNKLECNFYHSEVKWRHPV